MFYLLSTICHYEYCFTRRLTSCSFLGGLRQLRSLDLSGNQLTTIHESIGLLSNLESLTLANNSLEQLPSQVGNLRQLGYLDLAHNRLKQLPAALGDLLSLQILQLDDNRYALPHLDQNEIFHDFMPVSAWYAI